MISGAIIIIIKGLSGTHSGGRLKGNDVYHARRERD